MSATPGTLKVRYRGLAANHPTLATGEVKITVQRGAAGNPKEGKAPLTAAAKRLVGSWKSQGKPGPTYAADGTGTNPDASQFHWRLEGDFLSRPGQLM